MDFITRMLVLALIPVIIRIIFLCVNRKNSDEIIKNFGKKHIVVKWPKAFLWIGCIGILFIAVAVVLTICFPDKYILPDNTPGRVFVLAMASMILLLLAFIVWQSLIWKIELFKDEDYFLLRTFTCKTHVIKYSECLGYKTEPGGAVLCTKNNKRFEILMYATNSEYFLVMLKQHKVPEFKGKK